MSFEQLLFAGESQTLEFKTSFDKATVAIFSPGTFYGGISIADIQTDNYKSSLRNKLVAEALYLTNNIEKYGSGFIRFSIALRNYPELSLEVKEIGTGVELTFKRIATPPVEQQKVELATGSVESSVEIIDLIARKPSVTANERAQLFGVTQRAIEKQIAKLKCEGRLIRVGPNKGGHWQVQKINK